MTTIITTSSEPIAASEVPGHTHLFVIGSFDTRITFYSQQVRALNLVDALLASDRLQGRWRFAVIGAGASGVTLAAALATANPNAQVHLYDRQQHLLHLQRNCTRRILHPHLYDWPRNGSRNARAGLPLLDWEASSAARVAEQVTKAFHQVAATNRKLDFRNLRTVLSVERVTNDYLIQHQLAPDGAVDTDTYHAVFVAVGFGPEATSIAGFTPRSYWSDAGVPENPKQISQVRRTLISGNGDGGLIDFSASALNDFDHGELVEVVTTFPGIDAICERILAIDAEAEAAGAGYDIADSYDRQLLPQLKMTGLIADVKSRLHGNTHTTFHTLDRSLFRLNTAALNRVIAYLVLKAGHGSPGLVDHKHGPVAAVPSPPGTDKSGHWFDIGSEQLCFDEVLLRHGADRNAAFKGLEKVRTEYEAPHLSWLKQDARRQQQPTLTTSARHRFAGQGDVSATAGGGHASRTTCPVPNCTNPLAEDIDLGDGKSKVSVCEMHAQLYKDGKMPMDLLKSIRAWLADAPEPHREIHSRVELLKYLVEQTKRSAGINMRINYVGPLLLHPDWYHDRRDELEYPAPNLERELFPLLKRRNHTRYEDVKIIFRNVPRYLAKIDRLVSPEERPALVEAMLQRVDEIWPDNGTKGPDLLCTETGFHRHPFIFSRAIVDVMRTRPDLPTEVAIVQNDERYVAVQRDLFDKLYESCDASRVEEFSQLRTFIESIATRR